MLALSEIPPTLVLSDSITPPDNALVSQVLRGAVLRYHWFVAETKTRQEKTLARYLLEHGIPYFLPYTISKSPSGNRVFAPLLAGFVFVACPNSIIPNSHIQNAKDICKASRAVWGYIEAQDQFRFAQDLVALSQPFTFIEPTSIAGLRAKVIAGVFEGMIGTVVFTDEQTGMTRLVFDMQVLGQPYSTPVETANIRPYNPKEA